MWCVLVGVDEFFWDLVKGEFDVGKMCGVEVVINLVGENFVEGCWMVLCCEVILVSWVNSMCMLVMVIEKMCYWLFMFISVLAVGIYGDCGDECVSEESEYGCGFFVDVCMVWENEMVKVEVLGLCVVVLWMGVVLMLVGGVLVKMLLIFCVGLGGCFGVG